MYDSCFFLTIHLLKYINIVFRFWLLQIQLLRHFLYRFVCELKVLFLWDKHKSVVLGLYGGCMFNSIRNRLRVFQSGCVILHCHQQCISEVIFMCPYQHLVVLLLYFSHFDRDGVLVHCGCILHFS